MAHIERLKNYVRNAAGRGRSVEQIEAELRRTGWTNGEIDAALSAVAPA